MTPYQKYRNALINFRIYTFLKYLIDRGDNVTCYKVKKLILDKDEDFLRACERAYTYEHLRWYLNIHDTDSLLAFSEFVHTNRKKLESKFKEIYYKHNLNYDTL